MNEAANPPLQARPILAASSAEAVRRELFGWAWLAVGALAVAGVFALLLALSRIPGMDRAPFWPLGFFYKGLVIHVVFSLVIWLLGVFAFLVSAATLDARPGRVLAASLGQIGQGLVIAAFPCLFTPAFFNSTLPELSNYIPLIRHPLYDLGLIFLALGVLAPVARLFANLTAAAWPLAPLTFAMAAAGFIYVLALIAFAIAGGLLADSGSLGASRDLFFWGGGHLMQFAYAALMLANWRILAGRSLGWTNADDGPFRVALLLIAVLALPSPFFYALFEAFSPAQREAFRFAQFSLAAPTLIFAVALLLKARKLGPVSRWPWADPAFFTLAAALALFALGGVMGFLITGSDTRTPAHYHAVVTAVSVSSAGMLLTFGLDKLGRATVAARAIRGIIGLYAGGQFIASIGMFVAGGYGAARKTPTGSLDSVAAAGMAVHGFASIFTIIGGAAFVVIAIRALMRPSAAPARA
ncbi:MAG TPA: cbb3-type cytochrome c oxidase subunit I [Roseiarcus sp.]|nr:cbb3-type cytochrome c oxidase subunit I [Roseiarcus sp.]